ncbi:cytochrome P450 [Lasiosphaeria hispida]|uniref:Cytochrome P450 n=1 Tax=Lasiosphaeria hispida TaxID=260671 RepID=A0AAJ0HH70_9PEZI|nr:cytochrome P450 [Lasiosphaeria hispida]
MEVFRPVRDYFGSDQGTIAVGSAALLVVAWLAREVYVWKFCLRGVPGPFSNSVSCYYHMFTKGFSGNLYLWQQEWSTKYGRLVRIGPSHVLTDEPDVIKGMGGLRSPYSKSTWYNSVARFIPGVDSTLSMGGHSTRDRHYRQHAKLATSYTGRENSSPTHEENMDGQIAQLVGLIDRNYISTDSTNFRPCDFGVLGQYVALDVIGSLLFSKPFGFLQQDGDVGQYIQTLDDFLPVRAAVGSLPILPWLQPILNYLLPTDKDQSGLGKLQNIAKTAARDRFQQIEAGDEEGLTRDMLGAFISKGLRGDELYSELYTSMVAGSDSSGSMIRLAVALLVVTPAAYQKLNTEIAARIAQGKLSTPAKDIEARAMPYLQAVLRETLRLYPVPAELYKEAPAGGAVVGGHALPGGTWIGCNMFSMMRRRDLWGEDADVFRPERWIEAGAGSERFRSMASVVDLVFGSGKFQCLGRSIGLMELNKVIVELFRHFDFAAVNPQQPIQVDGYGLYLIHRQLLRVTRKEVLPVVVV